MAFHVETEHEQMVLAAFFMLEHMELPFVISYEFAFHLMHIPNGGNIGFNSQLRNHLMIKCFDFDGVRAIKDCLLFAE